MQINPWAMPVPGVYTAAPAHLCTVVTLGREDPGSGSVSHGPCAATSDTWRHPDTDSESEKSKREAAGP